jgi:hypothetical protein
MYYKNYKKNFFIFIIIIMTNILICHTKTKETPYPIFSAYNWEWPTMYTNNNKYYGYNKSIEYHNVFQLVNNNNDCTKAFEAILLFKV